MPVRAPHATARHAEAHFPPERISPTQHPPSPLRPSQDSPDTTLLENIYVLGHRGFVQTVPAPPSSWTKRPAAVVLVSAASRAIDLQLGDGRVLTGRVIAVASMVERRLMPHAPPLLSFNIQPLHPRFPQFRALNPPGAMALAPEPFAPLREAFSAAFRGVLAVNDMKPLFELLLSRVNDQLPPIGAPDSRLAAMLAHLRARPRASAAELGRAVGCSADWVARRFSADMGISLRDYMGWLKQRALLTTLFTRRSITEVALDAGFAGASQLSSAYQRWYGRTPSASRDPRKVRILTEGSSATPAGEPADCADPPT